MLCSRVCTHSGQVMHRGLSGIEDQAQMYRSDLFDPLSSFSSCSRVPVPALAASFAEYAEGSGSELLSSQ